MITTYLRFPSQEEWKQAALADGVLTLLNIGTEEEPEIVEEWHYYTHEWAVDEIGVIYNDDGVYDPDTGAVITPPTPIPGWHVNYKADTLPSNFSAYVVTPAPPYRKFAGD